MLLPLLALPLHLAGSMLGFGNMFGQNLGNSNRDINININNDNQNANSSSSSSNSIHMSHGHAHRASQIHY